MFPLNKYLAFILAAVIASSQSSHLSAVFPQEICLLRPHPESLYSSAAEILASTSEFRLTIRTELDRVIGETYDVMRLGDADIFQRRALLSGLLKELSGKNLTLEAFGSCCTGFGWVESDLDVMLTGNITTSALLTQLPKDFSVEYISKRKPLIRLRHTLTGLPVDLIVNLKERNNIALFEWYLRKSSRFDHRAQVLGIFLKTVVKKLKIKETKFGDLASSMYVTMLIHFLQQTNPPVLPGIPQNKTKADFVVRNNATVGQLWLGFLRYYVHEFNYQEHLICLYHVRCKTRQERGWYGPDHNLISMERPSVEDNDDAKRLHPLMSEYILRVFNQLQTFYLKDNYDGLLHRNDINLDYHPRYGHKKNLLVDTWGHHNRTACEIMSPVGIRQFC